jgi:PAS domain S-box-containing protein
MYPYKVSSETEAGFVVISLSDTKLGHIFMINNVALKIFKYNREEILGCNVSSIMPEAIGQKHDAILLEFLKKRRLPANADQRLLYGKDSNGFMFPLHLQLQKASYSVNDEFIFIALIKPEKLRSSPICCLFDDEGMITEYSTGFRNFFYDKYSKNRQKAIQEIIPNYYDAEEITDKKESRNFVVNLSHPVMKEVTARFDISPLSVKG